MIADKRRVGEKFEMEETLQALTVGRQGQRQGGRARHLVRRETIFSQPHPRTDTGQLRGRICNELCPPVDRSNRRQGCGRVLVDKRKNHSPSHPGIGFLELERRDMRSLHDARAGSPKAQPRCAFSIARGSGEAGRLEAGARRLPPHARQKMLLLRITWRAGGLPRCRHEISRANLVC